MNLWIFCVLFYMGGGGYMTIEFLWRGRSHGSMFLLGGTCFMAMGWLYRMLYRAPALLRCIASGAVITALELLTGLFFNRDYTVWDYRRQPLNFRGQICALYSVFWVLLSLIGMLLHRAADQKIRSTASSPGRLYK